MRSFQKLDMASTDWLTTHFLAKSNDRAREIASLGIQPGARVLDLCCGPGLYMPLLLDLVGPTGHVTGVDLDAVSLDAAHVRLTAGPHRTWTLQQSTIEAFAPQVGEFDVILLFNAICYLEDPQAMVSAIGDAMSSGATLVVKDFDLEGFFFQPRETAAWATLIASAKRQNDTDNPVSFDNFLGRRIHTLHRAYPFKIHRSETWTQLMTHPFNKFQVEYIWRNIECLVRQAGTACPLEVAEHFKREFYPPGGRFFSDPDAMLVETEYLISLTK